MTHHKATEPVVITVGNRPIDITDELKAPIFSYGFIKPHAFPRYREMLDDMVRLSGYHDLPLNLLQEKDYIMSREVAEAHYKVHRDRPFFRELIDMAIEGPTRQFLVHALNPGEDAIKALMKVCGPTDPAKAAENTIRQKYGEPERGIMYNAIHRSDSLEAFIDEVPLHFERSELGDFFWLRFDAYKNHGLRPP